MISVPSIFKAFFALIVYYGLYALLKGTVDNFAVTHSNLFDVFLVALLPIIIFFVIIISGFTNPDGQRGYNG